MNIKTELGSWPWTLNRYMQVWAECPWLEVKSSLIMLTRPGLPESITLKVWTLLLSRSYMNSVSKNLRSESAATSPSCPFSHPETRQSLGALDLLYATLCWMNEHLLWNILITINLTLKIIFVKRSMLKDCIGRELKSLALARCTEYRSIAWYRLLLYDDRLEKHKMTTNQYKRN